MTLLWRDENLLLERKRRRFFDRSRCTKKNSVKHTEEKKKKKKKGKKRNAFFASRAFIISDTRTQKTRIYARALMMRIHYFAAKKK